MEFVPNTPSYSEYNRMITQNPPGLGNYRYSDKAWQARSDWATMYYQNAYNADLMNYQNEYNSPLNQMLRYQEAGINPFLGSVDSGNMGSTHAGAAPSGRFTAPTRPQEVAAVNQSINTLNDVMKTAQGLYDYLTYGRPQQEFATNIAMYNETAAQAKASSAQSEADWNLYWNYGEGMGPNSPFVEGSPRARYMEESINRLAAQVGQLEGLTKSIYPSQKAANDAAAALRQYQKEILEGQKGAILQIDTGYPTLDAILKLVAFWLIGK